MLVGDTFAYALLVYDQVRCEGGREAGIACIAHRVSFFCTIFCNIQKVFKKIQNFPVVLFLCFEKKKNKKNFKNLSGKKKKKKKKKNPKKTPKENTDCMRYESQGLHRDLCCLVCRYQLLVWPDMAWLLVLLGAAGGQRVETFQKTQYILCMGWGWR